MNTPSKVFLLILIILSALGCGSKKKPKSDQQGFVIKGPIQGSRVKIYRLQGSPLNRREIEDDGITGPDGSFSLQIDKDYRGYLLFEAEDGSYVDEVTGLEVLASKSHFPFSAIVEKKSDTLPNIYLTPFSTLKVKLSENSTKQFNIQSLLDSEGFVNSLFGLTDPGQLEFKEPSLSSITTSSPGTVSYDSFLMGKHLATFSQAALQQLTDGLIDSLDTVNNLSLDLLDGNWDGLIGRMGIESYIHPNQFAKAFQNVAINLGGMTTSSVLLSSIQSSLIATTSFSGFKNLISPISTAEFNLSSDRLLLSITSPTQIIKLNQTHYFALSTSLHSATLFEKVDTNDTPNSVWKQQVELPPFEEALAINLSDKAMLDVVFLTTSPVDPLYYALVNENNRLSNPVKAYTPSNSTSFPPKKLISGQFVGTQTSTFDLMYWNNLGDFECVKGSFTEFSHCSIDMESVDKFDKVIAFDLNQDLYTDLIFTAATSQSVSNTSVLIYLNNNGVSFDLKQVINDKLRTVTNLLVEDISGDNMPDLLLHRNTGKLEFYKQAFNSKFDLVQTLESPITSQAALISFETNGMSPREVFLAVELNNQTELLGIKKTAYDTLSKTTDSLTINSTSLSFYADRYTSDTLDDLIYTDESKSQILIKTHSLNNND